jgi:hypothetical protein
MRFIDSGSNSMWYTDNDCDIGFSGDSISISDEAAYIAANKLATTSTWALLRVEMIDKTMVVFVNDKEVYRKTDTRNRSTLNSTLGGFKVEFREAVRRTTFYFNNTYVGAVDENYFGRTRTSIP